LRCELFEFFDQFGLCQNDVRHASPNLGTTIPCKEHETQRAERTCDIPLRSLRTLR
jgi:hypothetical protein